MSDLRVGAKGGRAVKVPLRQYLALLGDYVRPQWAWVVTLAVLLGCSIGLQLVGPQIMRAFIDTIQAGGAAEDLARLGALFLGAALAQQMVAVSASYVSESVGWRATNELRARLAERCLRLDMHFHQAHTPGEMIERLDGDVTALAGFFSQFAVQVCGSLLLTTGILALLWREDWRVGLALSVFALASLLILARLRPLAVPAFAAARVGYADLFGFLEERLAATEDIRACGAQAYVLRRFFLLLRAIRRLELRAGLMTAIMTNTSSLLWSIGPAAALAVAAYVFRSGRISLGAVYLVFNYSTQLLAPVQMLTQQLQELQRAGAAIVRIRDLLQAPGRMADHRLGAPLPPGALGVELADVSFGYCLEEKVLHHVSLQLAPGQVLGLLGRTGSGKTTISRLLVRLYDVQEGSIRLGGVDVRAVPVSVLRRHVGVVTQTVDLFGATVRDNLTLFDSSISDERILAALQALGLGAWLRGLPRGLDTELQAGGAGLSSGEAQLLALARIFLRDPGLVILDEASARLDPVTARTVERAVSELLRGRTGIIVAHRLATVQRADRILILEDGRVREQGERAALAADPHSRYHQLVQAGLQEVPV